MDLIMRYLIALLFCFSLAAQQTVNNFTVKTNLTVAGAPVTLSVNTIADLVALNPIYDNAQVSVAGYYAANDGGEGVFRRVLSSQGTANLGTFFVSTQNPTYAWERVKSGPSIDIRWFGARNNGFQTNEVYDSTASIQSAVNYANLTSSSIFVPNGEWISSGGHNLDGIRMYGIKELNRFGVGGASPFNTNATSVLRHKIGATNHMVRLLRGAQIDGISMFGRRWYNHRNEYTITSSTSSTITVSTNNLPLDPANGSILPFYGVGILYTAEGINAGTMVFTDIDQSTGQLTFSSGFDYFCTATNGLVPSGWKVSISPTSNLYNPRTGTYTTDFIDPTEAGWNAIQVDGDHCRIYDMTLYGWHVGIRIGNVYCARIQNLVCQGMALSGIAKANPFYGFDTYCDTISIQNSYTEDLYNPQVSGSPITQIGSLVVGVDIMDIASRYTPFGILFPSNSDQFNGRSVIDLPITGIWAGSMNTLTFSDLLVDSPLHFGLAFSYGNSYENTVSFNNLKVRSPAAASPSTPPYQLQRPSKWSSPSAIWCENQSQTKFAVGILDIPDLGLGSGQRFQYGLYFQNTGLYEPTISSIAATIGATNLIHPSSKSILFGVGHNGSFDVKLNNLNITNSVSIVNSITVGNSSNQLSATIIGGTSGVGMLKFLRPGTGTNSIGIGTKSFTFKEDTLNRSTAAIDTDGSTFNRISLGGGSTSTPRSGFIEGESASGTDVSAKNLIIQTGLGTGSSSAPEISFYGSTPTTSGSASQSRSPVAFAIESDGDIRIAGTAISFGTQIIRRGTGSPEGSVTAPVGSLYLRSDGGAGTTFYVKESGTGNTGWVAK